MQNNNSRVSPDIEQFIMPVIKMKEITIYKNTERKKQSAPKARNKGKKE